MKAYEIAYILLVILFGLATLIDSDFRETVTFYIFFIAIVVIEVVRIIVNLLGENY